MDLRRRDLVLGAIGAAVVGAPPAAADTVSFGGPAFGSSWRITAVRSVDADALRRAVEAIVADVDARMSPYRPSSDLGRFNTAGDGTWRPVARSVAELAREALDMAVLTDGYFDPTVGPLVSRYGFGPISGRVSAYSALDVAETALRKRSPGLTLDLCGIAKGHALDRIVDAVAAAGGTDALIEVGGEVRARGRHPTGRPWSVAIADPTHPRRAWRILRLDGRALATSGHAVNGVSGRVSASHIIDPHRRRAAAQSLLSVSVLAASAMRADALATALCAAGPDAGVALARRLDLSALFVVDTPRGPSEVLTGRFHRHLLT